MPLADGAAWFKKCGAVQRFEPYLSAVLFDRWPVAVGKVLAHDNERGWILFADAGSPINVFGNAPEPWLVALPQYAELQRSEAAYVGDHLAKGVPDRRLDTWPVGYADLAESEVLLDEERQKLRAFALQFGELCDELAAFGVPETIQHDDLHMANVYARGDELRILDWGDSCVSHPFVSLVVTFRFLEELRGIGPGDPWLDRLRDAYLEPWGPGLEDAFALALRLGAFVHVFGWLRQRAFLSASDRASFDVGLRTVLTRALAQLAD